MNINIRNLIRLLTASYVAGALVSCEVQEDFHYPKDNSGEQLKMTSLQYVKSHDSLALFEQAIAITELGSYYDDESSRTFIAPTDGAFKDYLSANNYSTLEEIPIPILRNIVKYGIVKGKVSFNDPDLFESNNPMAYDTENGQVMYLSHNSNFQGLINEGTSNQWIITTSNLELDNDVMHVVSSIVYFSAPAIDTESPEFTPVLDTIYPIHDSYINGGNLSGNNFGSENLLKIKNVSGDGPYDRKAYMMFDTNDFDEQGVIIELKLELAVSFTHAKGLDVNVHAVADNSWNEMGITWDNAPQADPNPIASIVSSKVTAFDFDITSYFQDLTDPDKVSFMIDGAAGGDETDEFASKEHTELQRPMLIGKFSSANNILEFQANESLVVKSGDVETLSKEFLEITGAPAEDILYTVEKGPEYGWLIRGANTLQVGDVITQRDIDVLNIIYINNGTGTNDEISFSVRDRAGSSLDPFKFKITIR